MLQNEVSIPYYYIGQTCPHSSITHHLWPFLIFTLTPSHLPSTLPPPINRAFQTKREGVRVEKEINFDLYG